MAKFHINCMVSDLIFFKPETDDASSPCKTRRSLLEAVRPTIVRTIFSQRKLKILTRTAV